MPGYPIRFTRRAALRVGGAALLAAALAPHLPARADQTDDSNVILLVNDYPTAENTYVAVWIYNQINRALAYDIRILIQPSVKLLGSWAGNPNSNPGKNTGGEVGWSSSSTKAGWTGPFVAIFDGDDPFKTYATLTYTGSASSQLVGVVTTGNLKGLDAPRFGTGAPGWIVSLEPLTSLNGIVPPTNVPLASLAQGTQGKGLMVLFADPAGPAGILGVKNGDVMRSVNGKPISDEDDLARALTPLNENEIVKLVVRRGNADLPIDVKLEQNDSENTGRLYSNLSKALEAAPNDPRLLLAAIYINIGALRLDTVKVLVDKALAVAPQASALLYIRGYLQRIELQLQAALQDQNAALALDPRNYHAHQEAVLTFLSAGDQANNQAQVFDYLNRGLQANPTYSYLNYLSGYIGAVKSGESVGPRYDQAIASNPYLADAYYRRALILEFEQDFEKAKRYYRLAIYLYRDENQREEALLRYQNLFIF